MTTKPIIIAIDGTAASGKGTLARRLAAHFDYAYLDTGALYRAVAHYTLAQQGDPDNADDALKGVAQLIRLNIGDNMTQSLFAPDLEKAIRLPAIGQAASQVARLPAVRAAILDYQRNFAALPPGGKGGAVLDGRDIGTIVCPNATHKFYVDAKPQVRAERRLLELQQNNSPKISTIPDLQQVLDDINTRDTQDKTRKIAPLRRAETAHLLDSSYLSIEEALSAALALIG